MLDPRLAALAERIRVLIESSPYTAADVARELNLDKSAVSRWMTGDRTPTLKNLVDLANLLHVEVASLWAGPEAIPATPEQRAMLSVMGELDAAQQQALLALAATMRGKP